MSPTPLPGPTATPTLTLEEAAAWIKTSTVPVQTNRTTGSGISLGEGNIVTSRHVVEGMSSIRVRFSDQRWAAATVARTDARRDLALLRVGVYDGPKAPMRESATLRVAERLLAVGYPLSYIIGTSEATVSSGIFSAMREVRGVWYVQTDAPLSGASG